MASDDSVSSDGPAEDPEIIPRPPSHPITTTLLIISWVALVLSIVMGCSMLQCYIVGPKADAAAGYAKENPKFPQNHNWATLKTKPTPIDHYTIDYGVEKDFAALLSDVRKDLHLRVDEAAANAAAAGASKVGEGAGGAMKAEAPGGKK